MKKRNLILSAFLVGSILLLQGCTSHENESLRKEASEGIEQSFFIGVWEGHTTQRSNGLSWDIKVNLKKDIYQIQYPFLNCGGDLLLISKNERQMKFKEKITYGKCVDDGTLILTLVDEKNDNKLYFDWYYSDGKQDASTIILKKY